MNIALHIMRPGFTLLTLCLLACGGSSADPAEQAGVVAISPDSATIAPLAQQVFAATVTGTADLSVTWTVAEGSAGGSVTASGAYTAPSATGTYHVVATSNADPARSATATVTVTTGSSNPPPPTTSTGRFVKMVSPVDGETFTSPATLRFVAAGRDPNVYNNTPTAGHGGNASAVQFFVDGAMVLEVSGSQAEYWVFKGFAGGIAAGTHKVVARAIYTNPSLTLDSAPVTITVDPAPAYGQVVDLAADLTVGGASYSLVGTPTSRVRVNGNGHRIVGSGSTAIAFRYVDFFDMGNRADTSTPGVDVTTSGGLDVQNCVFDTSNTVRFTLTGAAQATVKGNTFRSNMRQPLGQFPDGSQGTAPGSFPAVVFQGASTGTKVYSGNNGAAGWVQFQGSAQNWLVGGDTDADGNVLIGPRVGIYADRTTQNIQIRRNYTHHIYYGGWSQGSNYELGGVSSLTAEHNVIAGSSWPVRGVGGEFRYNLVLDAGHQWLWADTANGYIHHNVFIGGDADVAGIYALYGNSGIRIQNNTIDAMGGSGVVAAVSQTAGSTTLTSNLFLNVPRAPVSISGGSMSADYNLFWNSASPSYSDNRSTSHDVHADPRLASPTRFVYDFDEAALWQRRLVVHDVLAQYRAKYTPSAGSPAIDVGDPAGGAGNDIGAVGGGTSNPADQFGK